ncbi:MAG: phage major capsid protein [Nostocales cyanobacterium 94392]|nr:phage major capsid protein [Nostocales cyanobacterium 94392]
MGTGNSNKNLAGLVYHVDDSTNVTTYQGLSRSTYSNLNSLLTANSAALTFANLATDTDAAQRGNDSPTVMITTPAVFSIIERLTTPTLQVGYGRPQAVGAPTGANQGIALSVGANALYWRGIPILADERCTSGNIYTLNENHLFLYELNYTNELVESSKEGFAFTGFKKGQNQNAVVAHLLWAGQLVGDSPRTMARRTTVTS